MNSEIYFAIGILSAMVYFICLAIIIVLIRNRHSNTKATALLNEKSQDASTLASLRNKMDGIQGEMEAAQRQMWEYGIEKEEKGKRWQLACIAVAGKSVAALQSCYLLSETDKTAKDIYAEMLSSLKTVGVIEIKPKEGEAWNPADMKFRVRNKTGNAPYRISKLVYPGYKFMPNLNEAAKAESELVLEPAYIDVIGYTTD